MLAIAALVASGAIYLKHERELDSLWNVTSKIVEKVNTHSQHIERLSDFEQALLEQDGPPMMAITINPDKGGDH